MAVFETITYGKYTTEKTTSTKYLCYEKDIKEIRKMVRRKAKSGKYNIVLDVQKWTFDTAYIVHFFLRDEYFN